MSRRKAAAAAATAVESEEEEAEEERPAGGLQFNEPLSWRPASKPSTGELLRRLTALATELKDMDQEEADRDALTKPAKDLAHSNLLQHKDKGVRAWTACCLADIFRICAPEAPFTALQLKDIFTVIITSIIPALSDSSDPYNNQHLYVLYSLAQVKSIVLLTDVPSPNQLILKLFETCFDILSAPGEEISKNIEYNMTSILECMIEESQGLPHEVVDVVLAQFMRADPRATGGSKKKPAQTSDGEASQNQTPVAQYSAAYNMAKNVANTCVDRMARYVSQYFTNVIMSASSPTTDRPKKAKGRNARRGSSPAEEDDVEEQTGPDEEGLKQLERAHRLLRELWKAAPGVLQNVIPQVEAELAVENVDIRIIATEAIGDMASGIGVAGPPPSLVMDPAVYPSMTLSTAASQASTWSGASLPSAPQSFSQTHPVTYANFITRRQDKSPIIRAAWTASIGRILSTSAGGIGLEAQEQRDLVGYLAEKVLDSDEKVRVAAIDCVSQMRFLDIINVVCLTGGIGEAGSILFNIGMIVKDRKVAVRNDVFSFLGRLWGVASGEIAGGNERIRSLFGGIPSVLFNAVYTNDPAIKQQVEKVLYESFIPMGWPALKKNRSKTTPDSQEMTGSQSGGAISIEAQADKLRTERLLTLFRDLDPRAKPVFIAMVSQQRAIGEHCKLYLKKCEEYNGGAPETDAKKVEKDLEQITKYFGTLCGDIPRVQADLKRFAENVDRRSYALIRFCMADDSDYNKVFKSMKEILRRADGLTTTTGTLPETLQALLYKVSNTIYNRSHIHPIMEISQSADDSLSAAANELLKVITSHRPGVFKAHIQELCRVLQDQAPRAGRDNEVEALDSLKACASFATRFPKEVSKDQKFIQALIQYAICGTPAATAKYATAIIMRSSAKKEINMQNLLTQCLKGFAYGADHFMARLATMSQLMLLAATSLGDEKEVDPVVDIAIRQILSENRTPIPDDDPEWVDHPDEECEAKSWALKLLVNRLKSFGKASAAQDAAKNVYALLNKLIVQEGELITGSTSPKAHRSWLLLQAAIQMLKLSSTEDLDRLLTPKSFNHLATLAQFPNAHIRQGFIDKIRKYIGQGKLPSRFYAITFLLAFEPTKKLRTDTVTWLKARAQLYAKASKSTTFEAVFARLLSLLAHHPDFENTTEELKTSARYIMFYLQTVATEENIPLIYHYAQRLKGVSDAIDPEKTENLYVLSELAQNLIGHFADHHGWSMQTYAGKVGLPSGLFDRLPSHDAAQEIATKQFLPQELVDDLEGLVKDYLRTSKKRRSEGDGDQPSKKRATTSTSNGTTRPKAVPVKKAKKAAKTPKKKPAKADSEEPMTERRKSGRAAGRKSYAERPDEKDDEELEELQAEEDEEESEVADGDEQDEEEQVVQESITVKPAKTNGTRKPAPPKEPAAIEDESDEELSDAPPSDEE